MRTTYDPALAQIILDRMAEGEGMDAICADKQMPKRSIVRRWLVTVPEFAAQYEVARTLQGESIADEIIRIEKRVLDGELAPQAANCAIQSMQFRMARLAPKRWGNKVEHAHHVVTDPDDLSDQQLASIAASAIDPAGSGVPVAGTSRRSH